jgi:hypothetical protein
VTRMGRRGTHKNVWLESLKGTGHLRVLGVKGKIILRYIEKRGPGVVNRIF